VLNAFGGATTDGGGAYDRPEPGVQVGQQWLRLLLTQRETLRRRHI